MSEEKLVHMRHERHNYETAHFLKSTTVEDIEVESYFNFTTGSTPIVSNSNSTSDPNISSLYTIVIPVMLSFCILTVLVNLIIVLSAHWCRKPMSPTLYFSISLALADAYSTLVLGTGLVVNSLLPKVYNIHFASNCFNLTFEVFRLGGILVSNIHLLALAINHWIGIVRPLHYAATMTRRTAWIVIINSWLLPILLLFIWFSGRQGYGFLSENCDKWTFLEEQSFRSIFASLFFAPLLLMTLIYIHIFLIVRSHSMHRLRYQSCQQLKRNVKAVFTTVLILGTYIIGFMPAIIFSIIVCTDCITQFQQIPPSIKYSFAIIVNTLVILKALVDPIIYAARMADIQVALKKMRYDLFSACCGSCTEPIEPDFDRGYSTKYRRSQESKSFRVSSFNSNSSSRRSAQNNIGGANNPLISPTPSHNTIIQHYRTPSISSPHLLKSSNNGLYGTTTGGGTSSSGKGGKNLQTPPSFEMSEVIKK